MTKNIFMEKLRESLSEYGVSDTREIMLDFEQHFEDGAAAGETEEQVCEKLGDPVEIAKQYIPETDFIATDKKTEASGFDTGSFTKTDASGFDSGAFTKVEENVYNGSAPQPFQADIGKVILVLLVDILVFTWALPSLVSLLCSLFGITFSFGVSGIVILIAGILMSFMDTTTWLFTTLSPLSTSLFGVVLMAATPLLVIASIAATKGVVNVFKHIINWHSETFVGRKVCSFEKKNKEAV